MNQRFKNPVPAVDIIIEVSKYIILIKRANSPMGWALPGGFVDYGESYESCAIREALEETSLKVTLKEQFNTYSNPTRDHRQHIASTVFIAMAISGIPIASDDAMEIGLFHQNNLPRSLVFDHKQILSDYFKYVNGVPKNEILKKYLSFIYS